MSSPSVSPTRSLRLESPLASRPESSRSAIEATAGLPQDRRSFNRSTLLLDAKIVGGLLRPVRRNRLDYDSIQAGDKLRGWTLENPVLRRSKTCDLERPKEADLQLKFDVMKRKRVLADVKPWTIANRIRLMCEKARDSVPRTPRGMAAEELDLVALLGRHCAFLAAQPLLVQLEFARNCTIKQFRKDTTLFVQGDEPDGLYVVVTGKVGIMVTEMYDGKLIPSLARVLSHGRVFGDLALRSRGTRTATAFAESHCDVLRISAEDYLRLFGPKAVQSAAQVAMTMKQCVRIFETLPMSAVAVLADVASEQRYAVGELFHMDVGSAVYCIKEGKCTLLGFVGRSPVEMGRLGKGAIFGESCAFPDLQKGWVCRADTELVVYQVYRDLFLRATPETLQVVRDEAAFRNTYFAGRQGDKKGARVERVEADREQQWSTMEDQQYDAAYWFRQGSPLQRPSHR